MSGKKQKPYILEEIVIEAAAAEGKSLLRHDGKVIFIPFTAPGDIADIQVNKQKKSYAEGKLLKLIQPSSIRTDAVCPHFGICGGCKWQHVQYASQLQFKEQQLRNDLQRIAKQEVKEFIPILGSKAIYHYRNKLEFTFSNKAWEEHFDKENPGRIPALGFHIPGMFDKVLDLKSCSLAPEAANTIRDAVKSYAIQHHLSFFDIRQQNGYLRNLMLRCNSNGKWMLVLVVAEEKTEPIRKMFDALITDLPEIVEWCYVINTKRNDTWSDLEVITYSGNGYLTETIEDLTFKIRPQSFFQTNAAQAYELYKLAREFAQLSGVENVYDLYTGTGSIALFVAKNAGHVTGIEYVASAIEDAKENALLNGIENTNFYAGDMKDVLNDELIARHGRPDLIITDPPRDGMHPGVVEKLNEILAPKIVYISCNTATQARDLALLADNYSIEKIQAVDMFPHTHHVESIALLKLKNNIT